MSGLWTSDLQSLSTQLGWKSAERECLRHFVELGDDHFASQLCGLAFPGAVLRDLYVDDQGLWTAEVIYDNLLHSGEGRTEAAALIDALRTISEASAESHA
jgi:hypothetical protein